MEEGIAREAAAQITGRIPPSRRGRSEVIRALAYSRDALDGCLDLLNEGQPAPIMMILEELKRDIISQTLSVTRFNIRRAAFLLGVKYTTLFEQVKKYDRQKMAARFRERGTRTPRDAAPRPGASTAPGVPCEEKGLQVFPARPAGGQQSEQPQAGGVSAGAPPAGPAPPAAFFRRADQIVAARNQAADARRNAIS